MFRSYWAFKDHFPEQAEVLLNSLDATYKRSLMSLSNSGSINSLNVVTRSTSVSPRASRPALSATGRYPFVNNRKNLKKIKKKNYYRWSNDWNKTHIALFFSCCFMSLLCIKYTKVVRKTCIRHQAHLTALSDVLRRYLVHIVSLASQFYKDPQIIIVIASL